MDRLSDRFLFLFFSFLLSLLMFFQYFSLPGRRPSLIIQPIDHVSRLNISLSLFSLPKGPYGPATPGTKRNIFLLLLLRARKRDRERNNTYLTTSSITSLTAGDDDDRRQRDEATAKERKGKQKNQVSYLAVYLLGKIRPLLYLG